jgi:DNA-binding response OmpR family regulator
MSHGLTFADAGPSAVETEFTHRAVRPYPGPQRQVLVVDDDVALAVFLASELRAASFSVSIAHDGETALEAFDRQRYDLLLLDLNLPRMDGLSVLHRVRSLCPKLPTLVLTARSRIEDKVSALHGGADDCLAKPFSVLELMARVGALTRRNSGTVPNCSKVGDLVLYRDERRVERDNRRIQLTPREFDILEFLMRTPGTPVSRATLLEEVWKMPGGASTNIVDVYMKYVRDKVDLPGEPRLTNTIRGLGYEIRSA